MIRQLATRLPIMITPKWVRNDCQQIAIRDVVASLSGVLEAPKTVGETDEFGGPDVLTYGDMMRRTARLMGRRRTIIPVPVLTPKLSAYWVHLVTDVPRSVAQPLILGLKNPVVVRNGSIVDHVWVHRTGFEDAVASALA